MERSLFARAFAEWERRWREDPDAFQSDMDRHAESTDDYGEACAAYFGELLVAVTLDGLDGAK